jgi:hypothetical protein
MSALGHKRKSRHDFLTSALTPIADIHRRDRNVRLMPLAAIDLKDHDLEHITHFELSSIFETHQKFGLEYFDMF